MDKTKDASNRLVLGADKPKGCSNKSESEPIKAAKTIDQVGSLIDRVKNLVVAPKAAEVKYTDGTV